MKYAVNPQYQYVLTEKITAWLGKDPPEDAVKAVAQELERVLPSLRQVIQGATGKPIPAECPPCPSEMRCVGGACVPAALVKLAE